jgi:o-succinylbenzoate synthase
MSDTRTALEARMVGAVRARIPLRRPFATSAGTWREVDTWIIRLRDAAGRDGFGEATLGPGATPADLDGLTMRLRSTLAGGASLWRRGALAQASAADPVGRAVDAAIDAAALDLGLLELHPIEPSAAPRDDVEVNATIATEDPDGSVEAARDAVDLGFRCLKLKVGSERSSEELARRIGSLRAAVGDAIEIRLDANGAWDRPTAIKRATSLADLGIAYLEQPVVPGDAGALAAVHDASPVPIAADESVASVESARVLMNAGAVDVLVIKPSRVGGPGASLSLAREALALGIGVTISTLLESGVGLAAAARVAALLPDRDRAHGLATADALESDLLATSMLVKSGRLAVPGLGLQLDDASLDRWTVERLGLAP